MFTGIIEDLGRVESAQRTSGMRLVVASRLATGDLADVKLGDSIAVRGACLTVVEHTRGRFAFDVSPETLARTTLGALVPAAVVHLERALRLGARLDGHLVQGHVDGVATLVERARAGGTGAGWELTFELPPELARQVVLKGSIALDGVSLTVAHLEDTERRTARVRIAIVPHTSEKTHLTELALGAKVNVETDLLGKYVARLLGADTAAASASATGAGGITRERLSALGFGER